MKIKSIFIDDVEVEVSNLTIIVGPNGVGKTTLLRNLYSQFIELNIPRATNYPWNNLLKSDSFMSDLTEWKTWESSLMEVSGVSPNGEKAYAISKYLSHGERDKFLEASKKNNLHNRLTSSNVVINELLGIAGPEFRAQNSVFLDVDQRFFVSLNSSGILNDSNSHDLRPAPFLAIHPKTLTRINNVVKKIFAKKLFIEPHNHPNYVIDVGADSAPYPPKMPSTVRGLMKNKELYLDWFAKNNINSISQEGHGIRAAIEIMYALENSSKQIIFIDEPELHLYPTAKYQLGVIIGRYSKLKKQLIICTHDADMLRGLLHGASESTILRISNGKKLTSSTSKSVRNTYGNDILQSAFQEGVIFVEGVVDQYVYNKAIETKHLLDSYPYQVIAVHGADRLHEGLPFTYSLGIKSVIIIDYDQVFESHNKLKIKTLIHIMREKKCNTNHIIEADKILEEIISLSKGVENKTKGLNAQISPILIKKINLLFDIMKQNGIFIVPYGSVGDWVNIRTTVPPEYILNHYKKFSNSRYSHLTVFLNEIADYLRK